MSLTTRPNQATPRYRPSNSSPIGRMPVPHTEFRMFDGLEQAVIATNLLGEVVYWNDAAREIYGWSAEEALGRPVVELTISPSLRDAAEEIMATLQRGERFSGEFEVQRRDGTLFTAMVCDSPIYDDEGQLTGVVGMSWDLTPQKERERELEAARADAEHANRQKSDFLATVSHELRTPLTAILGYEELVSSGIGGKLAEAHELYLQRIRASALHLRDLIDQILSLSRILAGKEDLVIEPLPVSHFVRETVALIEPQVAARGLRMRVHDDAVAGVVMHTDTGKLRQVLLNLLANAVKFTAVGHVQLEARADGESVVFAVRDTGAGFDTRAAAQLFEPFVRLENARDSVGSGLGLAIVERLVRLLGGTIDVESELGRGSCFTVRIPVQSPVPTST